ncbi:hypothetical protein [Brevundimonas nasdae]|uniref:Uncharacterized protein n=1 Tax=Brevundimonas nasdae TaxID=172043 RepID=A0ACD4VLV2_9CAUL|nr:hypothetical protein [Brevundimonas nasdae]WOB78806.1 hypothetical protein PZA08_01200 [Brevundimonas nasdae]
MRILILSATIAVPLLSGCGTMGATSTYQQELNALEASCVRDQGILSPTGRETGRPQTEYVCKINGIASGIPPR